MLVAAPFVSMVRYGWHSIFLFRGKGATAQFVAENRAWWRLPWLVFKAHLALIAHLGRLLRQRREISRGAKLSSATFRRLLAHHSISARNVAEY